MSNIADKRILIMRHKPTDENRKGIIQGQSIESRLERMEVSSSKIEWCKENIINPTVIVCSSLGRAVQSAELLSGLLNIPVNSSPLLVQRGWGCVEGKTLYELGNRFVKHAFYADSDDLPQGAESLSQVCIRARKAWAHVMGIEARTVVVITHDEFGNYLINEILKEGIFKRPLFFNEAHLIETNFCSVVRTELSLGINNVPYQHNVLLRGDAPTFKFNAVGIRILKNRGVNLLDESDIFTSDSIRGIIVGDKPFTDKDFRRYPNLKVISRFGKGVNNVQITPRDNLWLTNTPGCNEKSVAEFVLALAINMTRGVSFFSRSISGQNIWEPAVSPERSRMVIGIVGLGAIGCETTKILFDAGFSVLAWTPHPEKHTKFIKDNNLPIANSIMELCSRADIVTLHLPATKETVGLVGSREIELMKSKKGYIINTSRAELLDYRALKRAIRQGWISGVALDVFPEEPIKSLWLRQLVCDSRAIATTHVAGKTASAINKAIALCAYNVAWVLGGRPESASVCEFVHL